MKMSIGNMKLGKNLFHVCDYMNRSTWVGKQHDDKFSSPEEHLLAIELSYPMQCEVASCHETGSWLGHKFELLQLA